ncbi:MAG: glycoside hydrolase family 88 protein [Verrucomicrobiota bacterium JB022]|nr:glycoside hydrolase family 88 protein [Verrucomicrobiota bacterium JB022]
MKITPSYLAALPLALATSCFAALDVPVATLEVSNPSDFARPDALVTYSIEGLGISPTEERASWLYVYRDGLAIPSQVIDKDADGKLDTLIANTSFEPGESATFTVVADADLARAQPFPKRTQADLSIKVGGEWQGRKYVGGKFQNVAELVAPPQHTDHSFYIRYEGPGLESDKVGYRFYLDWRNGFDIFGKTTETMVLQQVGLDGFDSYHEFTPEWGMDIMKVGDALGIGGPAYWDGEKIIRVSDTEGLATRIVENGPIYSAINTHYQGWNVDNQRVDLSTVSSMEAGSRLVHMQADDEGKLDGFATGIIKMPGAKVLKSSTDRTGRAWAYFATWGQQSLHGDDTLGLAIFFRIRDVKEVKDGPLNHAVIFRKADGYEYYFGSAWQHEPNGITTEAQFVEWLDQTVESLERPLRTSVKTSAGQAAKAGELTPEKALHWSKRLADSEIKRLGRRLAYPNGGWGYTTGLLSDSIYQFGEAVNDPRYMGWATDTISSFITPEGDIHTYDIEDYNVDQVNSGKLILRLAEKTGEERYQKAADLLFKQLENHPRTSEGAFWHKKVYPWQVWLDGVYMATPFYVRHMVESGNTADLDEAIHEFVVVEKHLKDPKTGLYYHAWDEKRQQRWANKQTGLSPEFWGRGLGWFSMALVDTLDYLPENHAGREDILRILRNLAPALVRVQDPDTGVWYQILDKPDATGNYREATASSMFVYTLAKAARMGYIDAAEYDEAIRQGYKGIVDEFIRLDANGTVTLTNNCQVAGYGRMEDYAYYMTEQVIDNDPKGTGPFILAGIEVAKYLEGQQ